ncbi:TPA: cyclic diguanylate phosphodiesterase [Klebsiella aerogenes]|nr:cyclic diguanylate phosphodiesterase [Klebsiella aerogenes]
MTRISVHRDTLLMASFGGTVTLILLVLLGGMLWLQASLQDRREARDDALALIRSIDRILDEATPVLATLSTLSERPCTPRVVLALNQLAAKNTHIRSVGLVSRERLYCSSIAGQTDQPSLLPLTPESSLIIRPVPSAGPDDTLLFRTLPTAKGMAVATFSLRFIRESLSLLSVRREMHFLADGLRFSRNSVGVPTIGFSSSGWRYYYSARYPYAVGYHIRYLLPLSTFIRQNRYPLILLCLLCVSSGIFFSHLNSRRLSFPAVLKRAIQRGEITPWFQPIVRQDGSLFGAEILARWQPARGNSIPPDIFIPVAEKYHLLPELTKSLLDQAGDALANIPIHIPGGLHLGLNMDADLCRNPDFVAACQAFIHRFLPGKIHLVAELTERNRLEVNEQTRQTLDALARLGIRIALDDFGTGYAGLEYIHTLNVELLKIDKSFTGMLKEEGGDTRLVDCVVDIARRFSMQIIAEGVETPFQAEWLASRGITLYQGWLYSRPLPAQEFIQRWVKPASQLG